MRFACTHCPKTLFKTGVAGGCTGAFGTDEVQRWGRGTRRPPGSVCAKANEVCNSSETLCDAVEY